MSLQDRKLVEARAETGRARGQNQSLEKEYLRLTSLPTVADVRPPQVRRHCAGLGDWAGGEGSMAQSTHTGLRVSCSLHTSMHRW